MALTASSVSTPIAPIPAFTTPFVQLADCSSLLTTTVNTTTAFGTTSSQTFILPDTSNSRYAACFSPTGSQFTFSPAVCPQSWTAWQLGKTFVPTGSPNTAVGVSTAYCCAPGYSIMQPSIRNPSCWRQFVSTTSTNGIPSISTATLSIAGVPAWHISWQTTDVATLSPQPPTLEAGEIIPSWVPGSALDRPIRDNWGVGMSPSLFWFLVVGIPLIVVALIAGCCTYCFCLRRRRLKR